MDTREIGYLGFAAEKAAEHLGPRWHAETAGTNPIIADDSGRSMYLVEDGGRITVHSHYDDPGNRAHDAGLAKAVTVTVAALRGTEALAAAIRTRFLPTYDQHAAEVAAYHRTRARCREQQQAAISWTKRLLPGAYDISTFDFTRSQPDEREVVLSGTDRATSARGSLRLPGEHVDQPVELNLFLPWHLARAVLEQLAPHLRGEQTAEAAAA